MSALETRTTLLLNWYANPYHTPIFVAQALDFYRENNIKLAILEPTDPSDVTETVGRNKVDFGVNVDRDWQKVARYARHLNILDNTFSTAECYTNNYLPEKPHAGLQAIACCLKS